MGASRQTLNQTIACVPVITSTFIIGLGWGWATSALAKLQISNPIFSTAEASWIATINEMGRLFSPFLTPLLVDNIGRKYALVLVSVLLLLVWCGISTTSNFYAICALRVMFGVANGILDVTAAIYSTENCSASFRGIIGGVIQVVYTAGLLAEMIFSTYLSYQNVAVVNAVLSLCSLGTVYFLTETPYFLIMKGRHDEAEKSHVFLQGTGTLNAKVSNELKKMKQSVEEERSKKKSFISLLTTSSNVKCIGTVLGIFFLGTATGYNSAVTYTSTIFVSSETLSANDFTILCGTAQFVAVCFCPFIVEKINRRTMLLGSYVIYIFCHAGTYLLMSLHNANYEIMFYPWLIFLTLTLYVCVYLIMSSVTYIVRGELLPLSVRAIGGSMAITIQSVTSFTASKFFLPITESYGMEKNFLGYTVAAILAAIFVYCTLPETRGKTLDEIQMAFNKKASQVYNNVEDKLDENTNVSKELSIIPETGDRVHHFLEEEPAQNSRLTA